MEPESTGTAVVDMAMDTSAATESHNIEPEDDRKPPAQQQQGRPVAGRARNPHPHPYHPRPNASQQQTIAHVNVLVAFPDDFVVMKDF